MTTVHIQGLPTVKSRVSGWPCSGVAADAGLGVAVCVPGAPWGGSRGWGVGEVMGTPLLSALIAFGNTGSLPDHSLAQTHSHLKADLFLNLFPQVRLECSYHSDPMTGPLARGLSAPEGTLSNKCVCDPRVNSSRAITAVTTQE